jgi:hypothetical protein
MPNCDTSTWHLFVEAARETVFDQKILIIVEVMRDSENSIIDARGSKRIVVSVLYIDHVNPTELCLCPCIHQRRIIAT